MPDIVLATLNAKYIHAAFGLRYLHANLGGLRERACIAEFDINQRPLEIVERILALEPRIVGLGVYIWNVVPTTEVVALLKRIRPELIIILGGPEVSYETDGQEIVRLADHTITGEADVKFAEVCKKLLESGERKAESGMEESSELSALRSPLSALPKIIPADIPKLDTLALPYELYTDADLAHRVIYVEASRGCPFTCEFCLSSLDIPVRQFPLDAFLAALDRLLARGATQFKFVDRTFNLHLPTSTAILQFFLDRWRDGLFVHFEMIPDRLPEQLRVLIAQFPPGAVQLEVGIQTFDDATSLNISRRQNVAKLEDNFRYLRAHTGVHIHADLIVGLPGEGIESFGRGFDRLLALRPQEIQVGILKRLRGTPIVRHDAEYAMTYSSHPPYEILSTRDIAFPDMQRMRRFARYWDLVGNSGNFTATLPLLWESGVRKAESGKSEASATRGVGEGVEKCGVGEAVHLSTFESFLRFSDWLFRHLTRTHTIALDTLAKSLFTFLTEQLGLEKESVASALSQDWRRTGRKDLPPWLEEHAVSETPRTAVRAKAPRRQARHTLAS